MAHTRRIPTTIRSASRLTRVLTELGFREVEQHDRPQALLSWNGKATGAEAEIIVRRKALGSTADDLGFARRSDGTFEAVISDIHLFRFDRKWFADLEARYARSEVAGDEGTPARTPEKRAQPEGFSLPPLAKPPAAPEAPRKPPQREIHAPAPAPVPAAPRVEREAPRGDSNDVERRVGELTKMLAKHKPFGLCGVALGIVAAILVLVWLTGSRNSFGGLAFLCFLLWGVAQLVKAVRAALLAQRIVQEFERRFPSGTELRDEARRHLGHLAAKGSADHRKVLLRVLDLTRQRAG